ncbi:hypothetical protein QBC36DRAFT_311098 [Triangularia setosa]|uniref:Uncharacterized protein n=1 Tax=Triangularia setosa TaxID=2587417 RepID=A0AAN6W7J9_9PEZI|nr:hypothetical protein QBC36DRAFT_311098 [Podospora setosa]
MVLWGAIIPVTVICGLVSGFQMYYNYTRNANAVDRVWPRRPTTKFRKALVVIYWSLPLFAGVGMLIWVKTYIDGIKSWTHNSGWMTEKDKNDEYMVRGLGQIAPLVALVAVILASLEKWVWPVANWRMVEALYLLRRFCLLT